MWLAERLADRPRPEEAPPSILPRKPRAFGISRTIHQTYGTDSIPDPFADQIGDLRARNPGWAYRYWNDKDIHDFIYQSYGWDILRRYLRINPRYGAARADLFRYLCIYQLGGVYLDIKSGCAVPLDSLVASDDEYILSQWNNKPDEIFRSWGLHRELAAIPGGEFQQWHLIAAAGHPFLERVILAVLDNIAGYTPEKHGVGAEATLRVTGPIAYTLAIHPLLPRYRHRVIDAEAAGLRYAVIDRHRKLLARQGYRRQTTPLIL